MPEDNPQPSQPPESTSPQIIQPINSAIVDPNPAQAKPHKPNTAKIVLWILAIVLIAGLVYAVIAFNVFIDQGRQKMKTLNDDAKVLADELNSIVFVEGQSVNAKGIVDGDATTASDNPAESTFAEASIDVTNKPLAPLESEVNANLTKSGFTRDGGSVTPFYSVSMNGGTFNSIIFRYLKGNKAIRAEYMLDMVYNTCSEGYVCMHTPKSKPTDKVYPVSEFGAMTVNRMYISYSDTSSWYHSGFLVY